MPVLTKKSFTHHTFYLDGEKVSLAFVWQITAKVKRKKSGNTRVEHFEVTGDSRENAHEAARRKFKGATVTEFVSCIPSGIWKYSFYLERSTTDYIPQEVLSQIQLPDDL